MFTLLFIKYCNKPTSVTFPFILSWLSSFTSSAEQLKTTASDRSLPVFVILRAWFDVADKIVSSMNS